MSLFQKRMNVDGTLDFNNKVHKFYYDQGCKQFYEGYDFDIEGHHAFIMALTFEV